MPILNIKSKYIFWTSNKLTFNKFSETLSIGLDKINGLIISTNEKVLRNYLLPFFKLGRAILWYILLRHINIRNARNS